MTRQQRRKSATYGATTIGRATAALLVALVALPAAQAEDRRCGPTMSSDEKSVSEVEEIVRALGYQPTGEDIQVDENCLEVKALDAAGGRVELKLHPVSGRLLEITPTDD